MTHPDPATSGPADEPAPTGEPAGQAPAEPSPEELARRAEDVHAAEHAILRTAMRSTLLLVGTLAVLGSLVGWWVAQTAGVWGALIGAGVAAFFCGATIWSVQRSVGKPPTMMATFVMGTWLVKIVVLLLVMIVLRGQTFYDPYVMAAVLAIGAVGSALLDYRAVQGGRMPYVQP